MDIAKNLFFRDSLGDLERHDCDGKQANGFNDLLRSRVIKTACERDPSLLRSNDDKYQRSAGKDGRHTGVNDRVDEQQAFHRLMLTQPVRYGRLYAPYRST